MSLAALSSLPVFASSSAAPLEPLDGASSRIALVRGSEILVGNGRVLRIASLTDAKDNAAQYKTIVSPALDFDIRSLHVNPTSKLVAVIGDKRAVVLVLPRKGWNLVVGTTIDLTAIRVDASRLRDKGSRIVKARWHHWSADGATLLIMTEDGYLREYDLGVDADEPQETIDFRASFSSTSDATFDVDEDGDAACSFCFGTGSGWSGLTLYGLLRDGSIYSVAPYLPKNAALPQQQADELASLAQLDLDELENRPIDYSSRGQQQLARARQLAAYAQSLSKSSSATAGTSSASDATIRARIAGPYLLQPAPRQLRDVADSSASDILALDSADGVSANILLVAHNDGRVNVFVDLGASLAPLDSVSSPRLVTLETVNTGVGSQDSVAAPTLVADPASRTRAYMQHAQGVHSLDVAALLLALQDEDARSSSSSEVTWQLRLPAEAKTSVTGLAVVSDVYLGHVLIVQASDGKAVAVDVASGADAEEEPTPATSVKPSASSGYISVLQTQNFAPPQVKLTPRPSIRGPSGMASTDTLHDLGKVIETLRSDIRTVVDATNAAQDRLRRQLTELPRQIAKLNEIDQKTAHLSSAGGSHRLQQVAETQDKLLQRTDKLLQRVMSAHQPGVSDAERAWFSELARLRGEVDRGLGRRVGKVSETLEVLRPKVDVYARGAEGDGKLGERQVRAVEAQLLTETRLIDATKLKIEGLNASMSRLALAR